MAKINEVSARVGLNNGFSKHDLDLALFGSHVYGENPHYPLLRVELLKIPVLFGWLPKTVWLLIKSVERQSDVLDRWVIKADIFERYMPKGDQKYCYPLQFIGTYSTHDRIGAGQIIFSGFKYGSTDSDKYLAENLHNIFDTTIALEKEGYQNKIKIGLSICYLLWKCRHNQSDFLRNSILSIANSLANSTDYQVKYLAEKLIITMS